MEPKVKAIVAAAFIAGGAAGVAVHPADVLAGGKLYADTTLATWTVARVTPGTDGAELVLCVHAPLSEGGWTDAKCASPVKASAGLAKELAAALPAAAKSVGF